MNAKAARPIHSRFRFNFDFLDFENYILSQDAKVQKLYCGRHFSLKFIWWGACVLGRSQVVRQRPLEPPFGGSSPPAPAKMSFCAYVLESLNSGRFYIGQTNDPEERLRRHNEGRVRSTKAMRPWSVVYFEKYETRAEAMRREKELKSLI